MSGIPQPLGVAKRRVDASYSPHLAYVTFCPAAQWALWCTCCSCGCLPRTQDIIQALAIPGLVKTTLAHKYGHSPYEQKLQREVVGMHGVRLVPVIGQEGVTGWGLPRRAEFMAWHDHFQLVPSSLPLLHLKSTHITYTPHPHTYTAMVEPSTAIVAMVSRVPPQVLLTTALDYVARRGTSSFDEAGLPVSSNYACTPRCNL